MINRNDILNKYSSLEKENIPIKKVFSDLEDVDICKLNNEQIENLILFCKDFQKEIVPLYVELWNKDYVENDSIIRVFLSLPIQKDKRLKKLHRKVRRKYRSYYNL